LFRDGSGKTAALVDRCCHRAAPLHLGSVVEAGIQAAITASFSTSPDAA
jgi:phenylpropionate dioxygenase-like ring-hydroxylating dioxygenase large terminal subunit